MENNRLLCLVAWERNAEEKGFSYMPHPLRTSQVEIQFEGNIEKEKKGKRLIESKFAIIN